ncbi:MAG: nuclear transport factor 2 family protein [Acidimicrobiia bacterium]|nr:nuclear transport factor 2 family protein [Acidimicrobiia bacterium]MDQ3501776.1 nuclear transport factor 2 family protein [Actinomycetota bacterium]
MTANLQQWIEDYRLAWVNRDPDAAAALFAPDATYRSNIFEDPHVGQEGVRAYWSSVTSDQARWKSSWAALSQTESELRLSSGPR